LKRFAVVTAILAVIISGCAGGFIKSKFESGIRNALPKYLGPAKSYTVQIEGSEGAMLNGSMRHLHIDGEDVQLDPKLTVSQLIIDLDQVRYNTHTRKLKSIKTTEFSAVMQEDALNHYVAESTHNQYNIHVKLLPDAIGVDFAWSILGKESVITVVGKPEIEDGTKVNFVADSASVASMAVPRVILDRILEKVNPIIDTSRLKLPMKLNNIKIDEGTLAISGNAEFNPGAIPAK
jgi:hypothetical protein